VAQPELMAQVRRGLTETSPEGYASCCEALAAMDLLGALGSISAPTLVIAGAEDPATPPDHGRAIADGIAGARFELIDGAAHLANIEKADVVTPLIAGFIDAEQEGR
jgi:pimeloyl-ACP methyl ester carboxylesterase